MYKSQFWKIDPYDWFCGPGSHMIFVIRSQNILIGVEVCVKVMRTLERLFYFVCPLCPPHAWMRSECILVVVEISCIHKNSHHVRSQQHPERHVLLFALFLIPQLCELVGRGWMEEGSCSRHTWQLKESSEESGLVHRSRFHTVYCKFSSGEFPHVRDEVAPAFWQIKSCRITSSIWPYFCVSILIISFLYPQRFIQYLASRNTLFNLNNFLDKGALQGMSETWTPFLSLKHCTHTRTDDKPVDLSLRLWHVHVHQAVQQISQWKSPFL